MVTRERKTELREWAKSWRAIYREQLCHVPTELRQSTGADMVRVGKWKPGPGTLARLCELTKTAPRTPEEHGWVEGLQESFESDFCRALAAMVAPALAAPAVSAADRDAARVRATEARTMEDAVNAVMGHLPDMPAEVLYAGLLFARAGKEGLTWAAMTERAECAKSTFKKRVDCFYSVTAWPRPDRRMGMGKKLHLDEARDGKDPQEDAFAEHSEHPRTPTQTKGERKSRTV